MTQGWRWIVGAALVVATILAAANVGRGIARGLEPEALGDLATRFREYRAFRRGNYPDRRLAAKPVPAGLPYSVYPAYVFPMFVPLFEPGGLRQGVLIVEIGSLCSLVAIGWYGWNRLRFGGRFLAALGAMSTAAISGVVVCLWVAQFSLGCVALLFAQLVLLERGKTSGAGVCWALAMVKPQIALPFAALFLPAGRWRGLALGVLLLAASSLAACWWTGVPPARMLHAYAFGLSLDWANKEGTRGLPRLLATVPIPPRLVLAAAVAAVCAGGVVLWRIVRRLPRDVDLLSLAGACGLVGAGVFYHRSYDFVMLAPAIFAIFARVAASPGPVSLALAVAVPFTAWLPNRFWNMLPAANLIQVATWMAASVVLTAWALGPPPAPGRVSRPEE